MQHAVFVLFLLASATAFALLEIQIEGRHGWAENLPTWRIDNRWTRRLWKKPLNTDSDHALPSCRLTTWSPPTVCVTFELTCRGA
jgi:hypothetical protein